MQMPENISALFTGRIELRDDRPVIEVPEQEIELGNLEVGETHRIAILQSEASGKTNQPSDRGVEGPRRDETSESPVEEGELIEVEIEDLGEKGDGIARVGPGYIVFIPDTKVGDRVTAEVEQVRENFAFAEVVEGEPITTDSTSSTVN